MKNPIVEQVKDFIRQPYAWPGGYPKILIMDDGGTLCPACAQGDFKLVVDSTKTERRDGWQAVGVDIHLEGEPIVCDNCGALTQSAYGDSESETEEN